MINLFQPSVGADELAAIGDVFDSRWIGNGNRALTFESAFGEYVGRPGAELLTVSSCSEGLFHVIAALGVGPGDEVVLPSVSFIAAAHAVRSTGAAVVLCDVDPRTLNPTVDDIMRAVTPATRAVIVLHYGGLAGDIAELAAVMRERSIRLVEDAACGLGSSQDGRACGTFGDAGVWSFDAAKVITTGDGGMIWARDEDLARHLRIAIRLGVSTSGFARSGATANWWQVDPEFGRRATMNDMAAAIGIVQLRRLDAFLHRRREIAAAYDGGLVDLDWITAPEPRPAHVAYTFYPVQCEPARRDRLAMHLRDRGIYTNFRYWPLHRTTLYGSTVALPGADRAAATTLLLPVHQGLSDADVDRVIDSVRQCRTDHPQ